MAELPLIPDDSDAPDSLPANVAREGIDPPPGDPAAAPGPAPDPLAATPLARAIAADAPDHLDPTQRFPGDDPAGPVLDELPEGAPKVEPGVIALRVIAAVAVLVACYLGRELLVTLLLAMFIALIANPVVTRLRRMYVPRWVGAMIVVLGGLGLTVGMTMQLAAPAIDWVQRAPTELRQLAPKVRSLTQKVDEANKAAASIASAAGAESTVTKPAADASKPARLDLWDLISAAPRMLMSFGAVVLLAYFFLVFGDSLQRNAIALMPERSRKQLTTEIMVTIESEVSAYVGTITLINIVLGAILGAALWWMGLDLADAVLWGTVCAVLNFAPYVGPITGILFMGLVGVVAFDSPTEMVLPAAIFLGLHVIESQFVTPIILGKRMAISPLVLLLWLMLWGWLWGIAGLLLAVPMLVVCKIVASRVEAWEGWSRVIE